MISFFINFVTEKEEFWVGQDNEVPSWYSPSFNGWFQGGWINRTIMICKLYD